MSSFVRKSRQGLFAIVMTLACLTPLAGQEKCSNPDLQGAFGFSVSGVNLNLGVQFALSGRFVADGKGHFSGTGLENVQGNIQPTPFTGTYTVENDCTGAAQFVFPNGITANLLFVLVDKGRELYISVADQGTVEAGSAKKQFPTPHHEELGSN